VQDPSGETALIQALRAGDERAFTGLVERFQGPLLRASVTYVRDPSAAEDVVQETWVGFLDSVARFKGRCSIQTWLFRILFNKAQTRVARDRRLVPFSTLAADETISPWNSIDPGHFHASSDGGAAGHWVEPPPAWKTDPEQMLLDREALAAVKEAIEDLPPAQATVLRMRDVEGFTSREVCNALGLSATNQRVLLHRARTKVRATLASRFANAD